MSWALPQPYETVEHTADTGLEVRGDNREEALARLILGLAQMQTAGDAPAATETLTLAIEPSTDLALVAVDTLRAMHRLFCTRHLIPVEVLAIGWSNDTIRIEVAVGPYDPIAHNEGVEIKAVTFHAPRFERDGDEFVARVILDV